MRTRWMMMLGLALLVSLAGCSGGATDSDSGETPQTGSAPTEDGVEDLTKRWGPVDMPDSSQQPLEFLYWRVDGLFEREDLDTDGRLSLDEYTGEAYNFERIDANGDGFITKKEVIDDHIPVMREEGKIP